MQLRRCFVFVFSQITNFHNLIIWRRFTFEKKPYHCSHGFCNSFRLKHTYRYLFTQVHASKHAFCCKTNRITLRKPNCFARRRLCHDILSILHLTVLNPHAHKFIPSCAGIGTEHDHRNQLQETLTRITRESIRVKVGFNWVVLKNHGLRSCIHCAWNKKKHSKKSKYSTEAWILAKLRQVSQLSHLKLIRKCFPDIPFSK